MDRPGQELEGRIPLPDPNRPGEQPPPLPPRAPPQASLYSTPGLGGLGYGSPYGGVGYGGLGGAYSSYGGYSGYNRFGYGGLPQYQDSDFTRMAEENSRQAFQSVESVVQTVSSVSMMLESTLNAVYSSFRAILGVADQFTKLKVQFAGLFTSLAIFRFLHWLWRRILVFLRLKPANYANSPEVAWRSAEYLSTAEALGGPAGKSNRSSLFLFALAVGGPWLMWRLISKLAASVEDSKRWVKGEGPHYEAKGLYDFNSLESNELSFKAGQVIRVAPKESQPSMRGWLLAATDEGKVGLVPMNYIEVTKRLDEKPRDQEADLEKAFRSV